MTQFNLHYPVRILLAVFLLGAIACPATAQENPFHVELNLGSASVDDIDGVPIDDSSFAFRLGTGYDFVKWLSIDGAFVNLGTIEATFDAGNGSMQSIEASADGFELTLTGRLPLTDSFALTAQAGMLWWNSDSSAAGSISKDSGNDSNWGVGAEYALNPAIAFSASWRRYTVENVDVDSAWLGVAVRFGDAG